MVSTPQKEMKFYLGTHMPSWLWSDRMIGVPLFVSTRRLRLRKKTFPKALTRWCLDSGGFSELSMYGQWKTSQQEYINETKKYFYEIGNMDWAAPQDWMCEPWVIEKTGLSVERHQVLTVQSYNNLASSAPEIPWIPVLQGWDIEDYEKCISIYRSEGVDLWSRPVVGVGSVCRRQSTDEITYIIEYLSGLGLSLHGFGVKILGLKKYGSLLSSADSMAWSYAGRHQPNLAHDHNAKTCANCIDYALEWRSNIIKQSFFKQVRFMFD